jgi:hypothetical protein
MGMGMAIRGCMPMGMGVIALGRGIGRWGDEGGEVV